ncbi:MAG TPA: hypothetical protein PKB04_06205, partial [Phenylobacterium sp.]|nr:hypothetical protein [Phenylobacterium sp.]
MTGTILAPGSRAGAQAMEKAARGRSLWDDARRRLLRNRAAVGSMIVRGLLVLASIIGPLFTPYAY